MCYLLSGQSADPGGRFRIDEWLGFGGRAPHHERYRGFDTSRGEPVVVKIFGASEWRDPEVLPTLARIAELDHSSLIRPIGYGRVPEEVCPMYTGPLVYVVEPEVRGIDLEAFLDTAADDAVEPLFASILDGLAFLRRWWRLCDIPARDMLLGPTHGEGPATRVRWSLIGAEPCAGSVPSVVASISRRFPSCARLLSRHPLS